MAEPRASVLAGGRACCKGAGVLCLPVRSPILAAGLAVCAPQSLGRAGCRAGALSGVAFALERAHDIEKCFYKQIFAVNLPRLCEYSEQFKTAQIRRQKPQSPV